MSKERSSPISSKKQERVAPRNQGLLESDKPNRRCKAPPITIPPEYDAHQASYLQGCEEGRAGAPPLPGSSLSSRGAFEAYMAGWREGNAEHMERKKIAQPAPRWMGTLQEYRAEFLKGDSAFERRITDAGVPLDGSCIVSETPGANYDNRFKDFSVMSFAVLLGSLNHDFYRDDRGGIFHFQQDKVKSTVVLVWRVWWMKVAHANCESYFQYLWNEPRGLAQVTIEDIHCDLQLSLDANGLGRAYSRVLGQLELLLPGLEIIEESEVSSSRGRHVGSGNLANLTLEELATSYAYVGIMNASDGRPAPTDVELAAYLNVDRVTLWRWRRSQGLTSRRWSEFKKNARSLEAGMQIPAESQQRISKMVRKSSRDSQ